MVVEKPIVHLEGFEDPGYYANKAALEELLNKNLVFWLYSPALRNTVRTIEHALAPKKVGQ